jgi:hypothetical protein
MMHAMNLNDGCNAFMPPSMDWQLSKEFLAPFSGHRYPLMAHQMPLQTNAHDYVASFPTGLGMKHHRIPRVTNDPSLLLEIIPLPEIPNDLLPSLANTLFTPKHSSIDDRQHMISKSSSHAKKPHRVSLAFH